MGFLKKLTKPLSKFLDKIIPNEIKPALPYLSAFAPFMFGSGIMGSTMLQRALMSGGLNIGSQLAQEGSEGEFSGLSALLAAGTGAMTTPGTTGARSMHPEGFVVEGAAGTPSAADFFADKASMMDPGWIRSGTEALGTGAEYLTGAAETLGTDPFSWEGVKAALVPASQGTGDLAMADARIALRDYENQMEAEGYDQEASDEGRRIAIRAAMESAGHLEQTILDALAGLGLREGGIVSLRDGGQLVKRGPGRPGYGGPHETEAAGRSYREATSPGGGGGDAWQKQALKDFAKLSSTTTGGTIDQNQLKNTIIQNLDLPGIKQNVSDQYMNLMQMGKIPQYGIGTLEDDDISNLYAEIGEKQTKYLNEPITQKNLKDQSYGLTTQQVFENMPAYEDKPWFGKNQEPTSADEFNEYLNSIDITEPSQMVTGPTLTSKDGGRVGALGGGIMNAKRGLVNAPGGYAGLEEIEDMREFRIANQDIEDVADYKGYYERLKNPQNYDDQGFEIKENVKEVDFGGVKEAVRNIEKDEMLEVDAYLALLKNVDAVSEKVGIPSVVLQEHSDWESEKLNMFETMEEYNAWLDTNYPKSPIGTYLYHLPAKEKISILEEISIKKASGGRINKEGGGMMSVLPKGREMDYRGGGVIPIGSRERADDVPARLSKNEFVMTADAVKAAGGGNINQGAKKMYNLMHNLEARV